MAILHAARGLLFVALVVPVASGCTTMRPIGRTANLSQPSPSIWTLRPGDDVRVTFRDGRRVRFEVQAVDDKGLVAKDGARYEADDILLVERRSFSGVKTAILVGAGVAVTMWILVGIAYGKLASGL
jgi:hypothetical protein